MAKESQNDLRTIRNSDNMKLPFFGSPWTQSATKHLLAFTGSMIFGLGFAYYSINNYPISIGTNYTVDIGLGKEQGVSQSDAQKIKDQYAQFSKEWKAKGKEIKKKLNQDLRLFKERKDSMTVEEMSAFDKEANSVIKILDKV